MTKVDLVVHRLNHGIRVICFYEVTALYKNDEKHIVFRSFDKHKAIAYCDSLRKLDYVKGSFMIRQNVNL